MEVLLEHLKNDPTLYLSEMADYLFSKGFPAYSVSRIWSALKSRKITRKVLEIHAREQNEIKRQEFLRITSIYTAEQRLYIDERSVMLRLLYNSLIGINLNYNCDSHLAEKATRRRYGRSEVNVRAYVHKYNRHGHRGSSSNHYTTSSSTNLCMMNSRKLLGDCSYVYQGN